MLNIYSQFFIKFMEPFFEGIATIFKNLFLGLFQMFNVINYIDIIKEFKDYLTGGGIFIVILTTLCLLAIYAILIYLVYLLFRNIIKYNRNKAKQQTMFDEIDRLNIDLIRLKEENNRFLAMADPESGEVEYDEEGNVINKLKEGDSRFFRLTKVDDSMATYETPNYNNELTLEQFVKIFRDFSASKLNLYYEEKIIRLFVASLASNKLIILQGLSGTGKTSLAYAFGQLINNETTVASVQPSWRDSTELFGYFNEFTKRYNETEVLAKLYEAKYKDSIFPILLDEMNISRVEYYFAEMLSLLELPNKKDWVIDLVPDTWPNDPKYVVDGRFSLPDNMWFIGTINNDDSTFMVTDKVYDRAMPINIDSKTEPFEAPETESVQLSSSHLNKLFIEAQEKYKVSDETLKKVGEMDRYVIDRFRLTFGNRIVKHIREFVPAYQACGGTELEALDYVIAHKILRKFEQLNLAFIKNEIDGLIDYIDQLFGKDTMVECITYLERLKKTI